MHSCLLQMFENVDDVGPHCKMDNLFISVNLASELYCLPNCILVHGVIQKSNCSVSKSLVQEEKNSKAAEQVQGTVKAAVLEGDSKSCNLIFASCYDQKPFYNDSTIKHPRNDSKIQQIHQQNSLPN